MTILKEIIQFKYGQNSLKNRYVEYIKDLSIPLEQRWNVYIEAPADWKEHKYWIQHFDVEKTLKHKAISWYDDFYIERNETVHMENIIERIEDGMSDAHSNWTTDMVIQFKEEILSKNLGSFEFDW